jgi:hypothetical protein
MERAITHWSQESARETRVRAAEQIFPDPELLRALDDEPPFSRVLAFRKLDAEVSPRLPRAREEGSPR